MKLPLPRFSSFFFFIEKIFKNRKYTVKMRTYSPSLNPLPLYALIRFRHDSPFHSLCTCVMNGPLAIFLSSFFSFEIINVVVSEANIFLGIPVSAADTVAVNLSGTKTLLANRWSTFFINDKLVFNDGPRSLPKNQHYCTILESWVSDNLILSEKLFA